MEFNATIKRVLTKRTFQNERGAFTVQPLLLETEEERQTLGGTAIYYRHTFIAELTGEKAETFSLSAGTRVGVALFFAANAFKENPDRYFQSVRIAYIRPLDN